MRAHPPNPKDSNLPSSKNPKTKSIAVAAKPDSFGDISLNELIFS
jgi:hypothetical protein